MYNTPALILPYRYQLTKRRTPCTASCISGTDTAWKLQVPRWGRHIPESYSHLPKIGVK